MHSLIDGLKFELGKFSFFFFLEKSIMLMIGICNNRASIPAGSKRIYRGMCRGGWTCGL